MTLDEVIQKMKNSANKLRTKFCFEETRDTIAEIADNTADVLIHTKKNLKSEIKSEVIGELSASSATAEVIAARGKYDNLKDRLDSNDRNIVSNTGYYEGGMPMYKATKNILAILNSTKNGVTKFYITGTGITNGPKTSGTMLGEIERYNNFATVKLIDECGNVWTNATKGTAPNLTWVGSWSVTYAWTSIGKNFNVTGNNGASNPYKVTKPKAFKHLKIMTKYDGDFTFYNVPTASNMPVLLSFTRTGGIGATNAKHGSYEILCNPNTTQVYITYKGGDHRLEVADILYAVE